MEKNTPTLIAICGVIAIALGTIIYAIISGNVLDIGFLGQAVAGLLGIAVGGAGIGIKVIADKILNKEKETENLQP